MKRSIASLVTCIPVLLNMCFAGQHQKPQFAEKEIIVYLYNLADVSTRTLEHATQHASLVLARAGARPVWHFGAADAIEAHTVDLGIGRVRRIKDHGLPKHLVVTLVRGVPESYSRGALGRAFPEAQTGVNAMIFYDRIERLRHSDEIDVGTVLGLAIVHEIGHVLLGSAGHSQAGIMKSPWTPGDVEHAAARLSEFSTFERHAIRESVWVSERAPQ